DLSTTTPLIGATTALGRGFGGAGQTVAILDTGVDAFHPFLSGAVVNEACFGGCANGSGSQTGPGSGAPLPSVISGSFHGTHVAGIAAGRATPGVSFNGVAPRASIMAVNVFHRVDNFVVNFCGTSPSPCALYWASDALAGLEHVFLNRNVFSIAAVNMSFGAGSSAAECTGSPYRTVVDNLRSVGIASVAAAGNDGFAAALSEPACVPGVISVGAVNNADVVPQFSNSANFLKLLAPGVLVTSSAPGGSLAMASGTSMAAPHVTGSWALLKQRFPRAGVFALQRALQQTGKPVLDFGSGITTPRVRVDQAVASPAVFAHDFTRDRVADIAVWRPSTGVWWMMGQPTVQWGVPGDIPVAGDYDGDGVTDLAIWRPATGEWWVRGQATIQWGANGDVPVPADYDGNGTTDIAVWRPSTGEWWVRNQSVTYWGMSGDKPVPADYDGNGTADIAVWRPSTGTWYVRNQSTTQWGQVGDIPVSADYDGNRTADIAVWRPGTGEWFIRNQSTTQWGQVGDIPIPRDTGAGRAELTVWRPSTGQWFTLIRIPFANLPLPTTIWGVAGDVPL
ncbi:MAG TPA: S8 family serine peptidase, partial [Povalibacter sp.]